VRDPYAIVLLHWLFTYLGTAVYTNDVRFVCLQVFHPTFSSIVDVFYYKKIMQMQFYSFLMNL
jgi:hypothetical protein